MANHTKIKAQETADYTNRSEDKWKEITMTPFAASTQKYGIDNFPRDFLIEVSKGNIPGHRFVTYFGVNYLVGDEIEETIWPESASYVWPTTATTMTVSSSDANDTSAGTGLRTILVQGLLADYTEASETVILNGQSGVSTTNSYLRINSLVGLTAGSGEKNAGIIYIGTGTITTGKPANVYNMIPIGTNLSVSGFFTIPAGKTGHAVQAHYAGVAGKFTELFGYQRAAGGLFLQIASFNMEANDVPLVPLTPPSVFSAGMDVEYRGKVEAAQTAIVKVAITLLLVDDGY